MATWSRRSCGRTRATRTSWSRRTCSRRCPRTSGSACPAASRTRAVTSRRSTSTARSSDATSRRATSRRRASASTPGRPTPRKRTSSTASSAATTRWHGSRTSTTRASGARSCTRPSGIWTFNVRTPRVVKEGCRALNDWALEFQQHSPRFVCVASIPLLDIDDAVAEVKRAHEGGFLCGFLPDPPARRPAGVERRGVGPALGGLRRDGHGHRLPHRDRAARPHASAPGVYYRGRGGAVLNYVETTYGGQRAVTQLIACGALDRHPELKVLVSEGGATWGPFIADRMDEGYRQHGAAVRPTLSKLPEPVPLRPGLRVVPARHLRRGRQLGHGMAERHVGQRLPALRGHVRPHPEDAARALRRGRTPPSAGASGSAPSRSSSRASRRRPRTEPAAHRRRPATVWRWLTESF